MSLPRKSLKAALELAASGAVGMALLLGAAPPAAAAHDPSDRTKDSAEGRRVAERLAAIREAVSELAGAETHSEDADRRGGLRLAWHNWGNGGWHRPWGNWNNWGWAQPWGNYGYYPWNNWKNARRKWGNWRNGWHNR